MVDVDWDDVRLWLIIFDDDLCSIVGNPPCLRLVVRADVEDGAILEMSLYWDLSVLWFLFLEDDEYDVFLLTIPFYPAWLAAPFFTPVRLVYKLWLPPFLSTADCLKSFR